MPAPALRDVQRSFWVSLRDGGDAPATIEGRFGVYADAYLWRLQEVLRADFPRLAAALGDRFDEVAAAYLRRHPSEHPSVRHLGRHMARHLAGRPDLPPALADLARLELARTDAFDAPDGPRLTIDALRAIEGEEWPRLAFEPVPSFAMLALECPAHLLWDGADVGSLGRSPTMLRVWRGPDFSVLHAPLDARSAEALRRVAAGAPFAALCDVFTDLPPAEAASAAVGLLVRWVEDGMLARR